MRDIFLYENHSQLCLSMLASSKLKQKSVVILVMAVSLRRPSIKGVIDLKPDHGRKMRPTDLKSAYLHRVSYISANVLLNLLNKLGKRQKMRGLPQRVI